MEMEPAGHFRFLAYRQMHTQVTEDDAQGYGYIRSDIRHTDKSQTYQVGNDKAQEKAQRTSHQILYRHRRQGLFHPGSKGKKAPVQIGRNKAAHNGSQYPSYQHRSQRHERYAQNGFR